MPLPSTQITPTMQYAFMPNFPNGSLYAGQYTLVFRVRNLRTKALVKEHRLILMPQRFTWSTETRTSLYYTKGAIVSDTPATGGIGLTVFSIAGHTGYSGILDNESSPPAERWGVGFEGPASPKPYSLVDGAAAIKDLQDTLLLYFDPATRPDAEVTRTQDLQLEFLNLTTPISASDPTGQVGWVIHPHQRLVDLQQDARQPFLYHYTLQFAALQPLATDVPDIFIQEFTQPQLGLQRTHQQLLDPVTATVPPSPEVARAVAGVVSAPAGVLGLPGLPGAGTGIPVVDDVVAGIRTVTAHVVRANQVFDAYVKMGQQAVLKPVLAVLGASKELGDAVGAFIGGIAGAIAFPLYAKRMLRTAAESVLDAPRHSVETLKQAAHDLAHILEEAAEPRSFGGLDAGTVLTAGVNDVLTLRVNREVPIRVPLGSVSGGPEIARSIQAYVRGQTPEAPANASGYRDFTATFDPVTRQYVLASGTKLSDAGHVETVVSTDPLLTPIDASPVLRLGLPHGGQEYAGSAYPVPALALLRGIEEACTHLQGFPDYFADQLETQDAALAAHLPQPLTRPQVQGDQRLVYTRITPSDTLQGIAARVGTDWQVLALLNRLTYPYILDAPATLARGRASSADFWSVTDVTQAWTPDQWQGQRCDLTYGTGAGQSRRIVRNTATMLVLESAWDVAPGGTTDYAIRAATNPIVASGSVSSATAQSLTDTARALVAGSQRGQTLLITSGPGAGQRQQVAANTATTYTLAAPWDVVPPSGSQYLVLGPEVTRLRQKVVGDLLAIPQPSAQTLLPLRSRVQDISAITGHLPSRDEQLFGRDLLLQAGALVWDQSAGDCATIAALPNLRQALIHLVNLPIGELEYQPGLGSYVQEELGLTATLPLQVQLLQSVERTIRQDARIARMHGASLTGSGGNTRIVFGATAISGASVDRIVIR